MTTTKPLGVFKIEREDTKEIARIGDVVLTKTVYTISNLIMGESLDDNLIRINSSEIIKQLPESKYLTTTDASYIFEISREKLTSWCRNEKIQAIKKNNRWLIKRSSLEEHLKELQILSF